MNLQDFVRESLVEIVQAAVEANKAFAEAGIKAGVNPAQAMFGNESGGYSTKILSDTHTIEFDVAVTVESASGAVGKAGLKVFSIGVGGETNSESSHSTVSRIKFAIPLKFPRTKD